MGESHFTQSDFQIIMARVDEHQHKTRMRSCLYMQMSNIQTFLFLSGTIGVGDRLLTSFGSF